MLAAPTTVVVAAGTMSSEPAQPPSPNTKSDWHRLSQLPLVTRSRRVRLGVPARNGHEVCVGEGVPIRLQVPGRYRAAPYRGAAGAAAGGAGGSVPPSATVFMFCSACMNLVRRRSLSAARAASSGSIELSKNSV